ncbi:response regulator [Sphingomonas sp. PB4P5]|uniref:response regulator n=1 Tax=Parasphingomonas puruogangriensis TaxID=3096155 RepID=UPI002FC5C4E3
MSPRILLIEDNELNRQVVRDMLLVAGLRIDEAESGSEGLRLFEDRTYDLLLLDLRMPDVDGFGVIDAVRTRRDDKAAVPIIVVSAEGGRDTRARCLALGADDLITKPISMQALFESIEAVFSSKRFSDDLLT